MECDIMRTVIFRDRLGDRVTPKRFYENIPRIKELSRRKYFNFGQLYGYCERVEFYDYDGYIAGEITVLNVTNMQ